MSGVPLLLNRLANGPPPKRDGEPLHHRTIPERVDAAVIGAGVIGLSIAWRLAMRGLTVALFDAGEAGGGTSAAATGMLAAAAELEPGGDDLLRLAFESQALWPGFRDALEADAGHGIDYRQEGTLVVAVGRDEVERLRFRHEMQSRAGLATQWLPGSTARELEPGLRPSVTAGILCADDHQVDPQLMLGALRRAFLRRGGQLIENTPIEALNWEGGRVEGIIAAGRLCRAKITVLATGPAIGGAPWLPRELRFPVRPLKGQSMAVRARNGALPIDRVVWTSDIHLAPKSDGRLILGATVEECGFDGAITAGGVFALLDGARRVLPGLEEMAIDGVWSGFRPTSDDDAPILGATPIPGLAVAAGHHRNGYLLAPVTARAIEDLVATGRTRGPAARFGIARFEAKPQRPQSQKGAA